MKNSISDVWMYGLLLLVISIAIYFRIFPAIDVVFSKNGQLLLLGVDPYFYLRQVETTLKNFPQLQVFDHATHYPHGTNSDATGFYTLFLAFICKMIYGGSASSDQIAHVLAWMPIVVTGMIFYMVFRIASRVKDNFSGLMAAYTLMIYPGLFLPRSLFGFADHHVVEVFLALWMILGITRCISDIERDIFNYQQVILSSLPLSLFFVVWSGAPLYIILSGLVFALYLILYKGPSQRLNKIGKFSLLYFWSAGILYFLVYLLFPDWITTAFVKYKSMPIYLLPLAGSVFYVASFLKESYYKWIESPGFTIFLLCLFSLFSWLFLEFTTVGTDVLNKLTFRVNDLEENKQVNVYNLIDKVSIPGILALIVNFFFFIYLIFKPTDKRLILPSLVFAGFMLFMWLNTYDMGYMVAPLLSILTGVLMSDLVLMKNKLKLPRPIFTVIVILANMVVFFLIVKPFIFNSSTYPFVYTKERVGSFLIYDEAWHQGMEWLRDNSEPLAYPVDRIYKNKDIEDYRDQYGVLTAWDYGNIVNQKGHRIPTWSRWSNVNAERVLYSPVDSVKVEQLCTYCDSDKGQTLKYITVDAKMSTSFFIPKFNQLYKDINLCYTYRRLEYNGASLEVPTFGSCYNLSLVYSLYRGVNVDTNTYNLVWTSQQKKVSGYFYDGANLSLITLEESDFTSSELEKIKKLGMTSLSNGILYDAYIGPEIKIYEVITNN